MSCVFLDSMNKLMPLVLLARVNSDGSVSGDSFGESDTRFSYILLSTLTLLGKMDSLRALHDGKGLDLVVDNVRRSMNFDGAFGSGPGAESHGAQGKTLTSTV